MKKVFVHIGMRKTATTSIQRDLSKNYEKLVENGVLYPKSGRGDSAAHFQLFWSCLPNDELSQWEKMKYDGTTLDEHFSNLVEEIENSGAENTIISCELMSMHSPKLMSRFFGFLSRYFDQVLILIYLRRQDKWLESEYRQQVKSRNITERIKDFDHGYRLGFDVMDYEVMTDAWESLVGRNSLIVKRYEDFGSDVLTEFLGAMGVSQIHGLEKTQSKANESISISGINYMIERNRIGVKGKDRPALIEYVRNNFSNDSKGSLIDDELSSHMKEKYRESNGVVASRYFGTRVLFDNFWG